MYLCVYILSYTHIHTLNISVSFMICTYVPYEDNMQYFYSVGANIIHPF